MRCQVLTTLRILAETKRFELLKGLTPYLVSSEAHSTGLCDVSKWWLQFTTNPVVKVTSGLLGIIERGIFAPCQSPTS